MLEKCNNSFDYFQIYLDYILLNELSNFKVYSKTYFINYDKNVSFFKKYSHDNACFLSLDELSKNNIIDNIYSLKDLRRIANSFDFLALDDMSLCDIFEDFSYISYEDFEDSIEGLRWKKIFKIKESSIIDVNLLKDLEIELEEKKWQDFIFPYVNYDLLDWNSKSLKEIYVSFFNQEPSYVPNNINELNDYIIINRKNFGKKKIISKYLANYLDAPLLYVGKEPTKGVNRSVFYNIKYEKGNVFENKDYIDDFNKYIKDHSLFTSDKNFYKEIHNLVKKDIFSYLEKKSYGEWYHFLEVSAELITLLQNIIKVFDFCIDFIKKNELKVSKSKEFDFFDYEKKHGIDFVLSDSLTSLKKDTDNIKNKAVKYTIISNKNVHEIDLIKLSNEEKKYKNVCNFNEFFNWFIIDY